MKKLQDNVALITGSGSGIGRATALTFAKEGAKLVLVDVDVTGGNETKAMIEDMGGEAIFVEADVSSAADAEKMVKSAVDMFGRLDILFNNAGVAALPVKVAEIDEAEWDRVMNINLKGVFLGSKYALQVMVRKGCGVIINTGSSSGITAVPYTSAYAAAKAGVIQLTKSMAIEYGSKNIRVNCICPGFIETSMTSPIIPDNARSQKLYSHLWPLGIVGSSEDIAKAALYLASKDSAFVTGTVLQVDGGWLAGTTLPLPEGS